MAFAFLAAANVARKAIPSGVYKYGAVAALGLAAGLWFAVQFLVPPPSVQIKYITRVIEAQEPLQEIVVVAAQRRTEIEFVDRIIEKEVIRYVDRETDPVACNTPIGTVRLLNDARSGRLREDSLQGTAAELAEEGRQPSTVTRSDLYESDAAIAIQYNLAATQLNALIDWIDVQQKSLDQ